MPESITEVTVIDGENGDTLWWDAIFKEMKNVRIAFEKFKGDKEDIPPEYQFVNCHMIFDIKMGEGFRRNVCMVAGGHITEATSLLIYSSVVYRDSVRIALTISALIGLKVLECDIQNDFLRSWS